MNSIIQEEFDRRQDDIELIIDLVNLLSEGDTIDVLMENSAEIKSYDYDSRLISTLSSVISLMTYNQIESTMRGCLESLYDDISDNEISYEELKQEIQKEVLSGLIKKYETGNKLHSVVESDFNQRAPVASLNIRKIFNGNIDSKKVYTIRDIYGVSIANNPNHRNGVDITTFKDARNDLAHGNVSFSEYGDSNPYTDTISKSGRVSEYLRAVIYGFDDYIEQKNYKS